MFNLLSKSILCYNVVISGAKRSLIAKIRLIFLQINSRCFLFPKSFPETGTIRRSLISTRRPFDVHSTSITLKRRRTDVKQSRVRTGSKLCQLTRECKNFGGQ